MTKPNKLTKFMKVLNLDADNNRNAIHWEVRRGTEKEAVAYCNKIDTRKKNYAPVSLGSVQQQGKRTGGYESSINEHWCDMKYMRSVCNDAEFALYVRTKYGIWAGIWI